MLAARRANREAFETRPEGFFRACSLGLGAVLQRTGEGVAFQINLIIGALAVYWLERSGLEMSLC